MSKATSRRQARIEVFQALYALGEDFIGDVSTQLEMVRASSIQDDEAPMANKELVAGLVVGVEQCRDEAIEIIEQALEVPLVAVNRIEQVVMTMAVVELLVRPQTPKAVVINEWIEVAKEFGAQTGYKLVNAVLDSLVLPMKDRVDGN